MNTVNKHKIIMQYGHPPRATVWLLFMLVLICGITPAFGQFAGGSGTAGDPYQISNITELQAYNSSFHQSNYFILTNDIDASATASWNGGQGFAPNDYFNGNFDGQGFTISNLTINRSGTYQAAIFSSAGSASEFKNINFANVSITGDNRTATLVGTMAGTIDNVTVTGTINGANKVGGLVGQLDSDGSITNSELDVAVTGSGDFVGGLLGLLNSGASVDNINVSGSVSGVNLVGGLTGQANSGSSITNSHTDVTVTGTGLKAGGLLGYNNQGTIENTFSLGSVNGNNEVGGLVGYNAGSITDSHSESTVTGNTDVGGLAGRNHNSIITNAYSLGQVTGNQNVGGLVGRSAWSASLIIESHSASNVNGNINVGGLVGFNNQAIISQSYATGAVLGNQNVGGLAGENLDGIIELSYSSGNAQGVTNLGGLVGLSQGWSNSIINMSFSTSNVFRAPGGGNVNQFGGLVGRLGGSSSIQNSFARGSVTGDNRIGGLVGEINNTNATVINSYSTGLVTGSSGQVGGLIGRNQNNQENNVSNSFWDRNTSGMTDSAGGTSKTTTEMLTPSTFTNAGWDFNNIWSMDAAINDGYPYLIPNPPGGGVPGIYYSRTNGVWSDANTWSTDGHSGSPATRPPIPPDQVIIGNNHQVTLTDDVTNNQSVTVNATGTLATGQYVVEGNGNFFLQAVGTLQIGSADGITSTAAAGSIQTLGRSFSSEANYVYNGIIAQQTGNALPPAVNDLRIDNSQGVKALASLTVNGQLQLDNGIFTMPPGSSLVANNVDQTNGNIRMQLTIDGDKGWRMITSPVTTDFSDLLDGFVSQGFTGATFPSKQPNILWFDETEIGTTNMAWRAPSNISDNVAGGLGHFYYIFNGAEIAENGNGTGQFYDDELPITMDATGLEYATGGSTFNFNITHTERSETDITDTDIIEMNTGWNLVGNPSTASLDWNAAFGWTKNNVDETIYIWDPAANAGNGDFLFWNGSTGTLDNGLIAPFQAFWVRANNQNPVLAMGDNVKTTGGTFTGSGFGSKLEIITAVTDLHLKLEAGGMESTAFLSFSEKARMGEDPYDAYQLESLSDNWLNLYTTAPCCQYPLVINHLPDNLEDILHIPVHVQGQQNHMPLGGTYKLSWSMPDKWPLHWQAVLMDHAEKKAIPMDNAEGSVSFLVHQTAQGAPAYGTSSSPLQMPHNVITGRTAPTNSDGGSDVVNPKTTPVNTAPAFSIVIFPGPEEVEYMAPEPILLPVYPNPVSHFANIRFNLPRRARVNIEVFDLYGRRVSHILNGEYAPGIHAASWTPAGLRSGVYFVIMETGDSRETQKLIVQ